MKTALTLTGIACIRGGRLLFEGIDLALGSGEAAVVTGPNGIGKSSLLRIAAGLLASVAGRVARDGGIALAADGLAFDLNRPLMKALGHWTRIDGRGAGEVSRALDAMGIARLGEVPVRMLSSGQRRRASLARVVASGAAVWLLDEPGNGLDTDGLARLGAAMAAHRAGGGIVLAATHQPIGLDDARELRLGSEA